MSDAGQSNIPTEWVFYFFRIWRDDLDHSIRGDEALRIFKEKSKSLCEPFRSAAEWVPEGSSCNIDQLKYWPSEPWDNLQGRVTLAGDAAHSAMPCKSSPSHIRRGFQSAYTQPVRGQGFNRSMEDALQLVETVVQIRDGADREEAMRAYDRDVCERGRRAALDSVDEGQRNMDYERLMTSETVSKGFEKGKF